MKSAFLFQTLLDDGKETMVTKPSTDSVTLSYLICEKGNKFTHTQVGTLSQSKPTINLNASSAIISTKIRDQSGSVASTVVDVDSAFHSDEINGCWNVSKKFLLNFTDHDKRLYNT